jgi:outer membrane protein OmpA-like peptidoglycan-associated protein
MHLLGLVFAIVLVSAPAVFAQNSSSQQMWASLPTPAGTPVRDVPAGEKLKVEGIIVDLEADTFVVRDERGVLTMILLTGQTSVRTEGNLFKPGKGYNPSDLVRGLAVEVEGRGNSSGQLEAKKVRFEKHDLKVARSIDSRVTPAEKRLTRLEADTMALAGQLDELAEISKIMRGDIDTNRQNIVAVDHRVTATNDRIMALDEFAVAHQATVLFEVNSAVLTPKAKAALDQVGQAALSTKGYVIEVAGFTDSTGSLAKNRMLSLRRAEAVTQYLAENYAIPLRRMSVPFGYGEARPAADNATREGRELNRRVDVMVMTSKGYAESVPSTMQQ